MLRLILVLLTCTNLTGCGGLFDKDPPRVVVQWKKVNCEGASEPAAVSMLPTDFVLISAPTKDDPNRQLMAIDFVGMNNLLTNVSRMTTHIEQRQAQVRFYQGCIANHNSLSDGPPLSSPR